MKRKGFTLIELTVVMGVISLLVALAVPASIGHKKDIELVKILNEMRNLQQESLKHQIDNGESPKLGNVIELPFTIMDKRGNERVAEGDYYYISEPNFVNDTTGEVYYKVNN